MATLMGTPYERGKSDVIVSRRIDAPVAEGLVVADAGNGKVKAYTGSETPFGIMGQNEIVGCSVVTAGLKVYAQADEGCTPTVGSAVYVNASGKVTHDSSGTKLVNAEFAEGACKENGVVENVAPKKTNQKCVAINFVGGL